MNSDGRSGGVEDVKRMGHDYPATSSLTKASVCTKPWLTLV